MQHPRSTSRMAKTSHIKRKQLDLAYANLSATQKLDIYWPDEGSGPFPVILSIHGGAFRAGDKGDNQVNPMLRGLKRGYAVVAINYRMSGESLFPALVHDVKAAIRWVRANSARLGFNPDKIAAWGASAGGYLAAMAGVSAGVAHLEDLRLGNADQPCNVQAVVDWYGPTDFLKMDEQLIAAGMPPAPGEEHNSKDSPESQLLGAIITEIPALVQKANPETYITASAPPFMIQHGTKDAIVPAMQSVKFAEKLTGALGYDNVVLEMLEGARHADPAFEIPSNVDDVLDFLDEHLKN